MKRWISMIVFIVPLCVSCSSSTNPTNSQSSSIGGSAGDIPTSPLIDKSGEAPLAGPVGIIVNDVPTTPSVDSVTETSSDPMSVTVNEIPTTPNDGSDAVPPTDPIDGSGDVVAPTPSTTNVTRNSTNPIDSNATSNEATPQYAVNIRTIGGSVDGTIKYPFDSIPINVPAVSVRNQNGTPPPLPPPPSDPIALSVNGNQILRNDQPFRLIGANRAGTEFTCVQGGDIGNLGWNIFGGDSDQASIAAMLTWHINTIRVPLNEDCWLGINGVNPIFGAAIYQDAIKDYVTRLHQNGLYVILDLHWTAPGTNPAQAQQPMADQDHSPQFWTEVATAYKNDSMVVFDLFNEPFLGWQGDPKDQQGNSVNTGTWDSWNCWQP